ncbi:MAG: M28 family peptidase [Chitinophagia bacterium]|nr:M28 family peptidase [Chitinophagia bacterium]
MKRILSLMVLLWIGGCISVLRAQPSAVSLPSDSAGIKQWLKTEIEHLADSSMHGRGYVKGGRDSAAAYLTRRFAQIGLKPLGRKKMYAQPYTFSVSTFPGKMELILNGNTLVAGKDYMVDPGSVGCVKKDTILQTIDLSKITSTEDWEKQLTRFKPNGVYYLKNIDIAEKVADLKKRQLGQELPPATYIVPQKEKFTWWVEESTNDATVIFVRDYAMQPYDSATVSINIEQKTITNCNNENLIGYVPGTQEDNYVIVSAHYDHLGMMGTDAIFPGASDNASGCAMMLYLAQYFMLHPQKYSMVFIAFSGEEAGLKGSKYFTNQPIVMLNKIKFLLNIDIMGDATEGITVVNATEYPDEYATLIQANRAHSYLPDLKSRGPAANSDHYHFFMAGVPSFFAYSNGGKGYYHDTDDKPETLSLKNIDAAAQLFIDYLCQLNK